MSSKVEQIMMGLKDESQIANLSRFFKTGKGQYGEGDLFLGIKVPQTREVVKGNWKDCTMADIESMISSPYHEIRLCALLTLVQMFRHAKKDPAFQQECVDFYLSHTEYINNWDLVDLSCYEILGTWLLKRDRSILYELARNGKTIWEQRIAMVSCMALVRNGELDDCIRIADILLHHKHDLMHKAVGWMLREVDKRDPVRLRDYLRTAREGEALPRYKSMPRTALRYAIEKFPEEERLEYLRG